MGLNDPQWGKKKDDSGPPDLDEVLKNVNKKISNIFGGKGGGNGGGKKGSSDDGPAHVGGKGMTMILMILVVVWIASGFYIVNEGQRGVVLQFGAYQETTQAGLRWHMPYPIESVELVDVSQVRTVEIGYRNNVRSKVLRESLMITDDENIVDIQFAVQYILNSPQDFIFNNRSPEESVLQAAETAIREMIGKSRMDHVLYEGREEVAAGAQTLMQNILDRYEIGISISRVTMQNAQPPEQVQAAFDDAVKAGQDRQRQRNEGEAYANQVIPVAAGNAARLLEESAGYKERVIASAEGDASRFEHILAEYTKSPDVMRERLYLDAMQEVLSNTSKIVVDQKNGNNLLYLPLDRLGQMREHSSAPHASHVSPSSMQDMIPDTSIRETFRGREREIR